MKRKWKLSTAVMTAGMVLSLAVCGGGSLADDISAYSNEGKTLSWNWFKYPDGAVNEYGALMQAYVDGQKTGEEMLQDFTKV